MFAGTRKSELDNSIDKKEGSSSDELTSQFSFQSSEARAKIRESELRKNPEWVEKEKARAREKYQRLNYKEKQKKWNEKRPWTKTCVYKNLNRHLRIKGLLKDGQTAHHWNYNLLKDVFVIDKKLHRKLHKYITLDQESLCFNTIEGNLLDTREKHENYINIIKDIK